MFLFHTLSLLYHDPVSLAWKPSPTTDTVEYLTSMWDVENALLFAAHPCLRVDLSIIGIAQVDASAAFLWDACGQRNRDARRFDAGCGVVGSRSLDMRAVRQNTARHVLKTLPLLDEIIPDVVADFVNQFAVSVGDLGDMRCVDNDFAAIGNRRFGFVHGLGRRPQIIVHLSRGGEDALKWTVDADDVELRGQIGCLAQHRPRRPSI